MKQRSAQSRIDAARKLPQPGRSQPVVGAMHPRPRPWLPGLGMTLLVLVCLATPSGSQSTSDEYRVKAAFLYHFAQLIEWPTDSFAAGVNSFLLCTLGEDSFHGELETIEGKAIGARAIRLRQLARVQEARGCQMVFISKSESTRASAVVEQLRSLPIVTVGESEQFVRQGGTIGFCLENNKVRFAINREAAGRARVKISSRLLVLAKTVIDGAAGG